MSQSYSRKSIWFVRIIIVALIGAPIAWLSTKSNSDAVEVVKQIRTQNERVKAEERTEVANKIREINLLHQVTIYWWYEGLNPKNPTKPWALKHIANADDLIIKSARGAGFRKSRIAPFDPKTTKDGYILIQFPAPPQEMLSPEDEKGADKGGDAGPDDAFPPSKQIVLIQQRNKYFFIYKPPDFPKKFVSIIARKKESIGTLYERGFKALYRKYHNHLKKLAREKRRRKKRKR